MGEKRKFLEYQRQFIESSLPEVVLSGGYGSGKTYSLCTKLLFLSLRYPHNRGFLCRKTLQSLKTSTLKTLLDGDGGLPPVLPEQLIEYSNKQDRIIRLTNGSEILYGNLDREQIKSMNLGWAAVDETTEVSEEDWNALKGRLRLDGVPVRQLFGSTNPDSDTSWLYNRFVSNPQVDRSGNKIGKMIFSSTLENTYLPKEYIDGLESSLFGHYYDRYVLGKWVGAGKVVFDNFNYKVHVIPNFDPPKNWKRFRSFDFGYRSPFSCLWIVQCGDDVKKYDQRLEKGDFILYRELYYTERTTLINAQRVVELSKYSDGTDEKFQANIADWDAGDRAELEAVGIRTIMADKDIQVGIQKFRELLGNIDPTRGIITRPTFYIFENTLAEYDPKIRINLENGTKNNNPTCLKEELSAYSWKTKQDGTIKEEPEDKFNHACDAVRYFANTFRKAIWKTIEFLRLGA